MPTHDSFPRLLMCPPTWFEVSYKINSFMEGNIGRVDRSFAQVQWERLYDAVEKAGAKIEVMTPQPQPDIVFTANAGLVWGDVVVPARFMHSERQGEERFYTEWFKTHGFSIEATPPHAAFEGEGDVVVREDFLFMGHSSRTSTEAAAKLHEVTHLEVVELELNPDGFYHLDTCMVSEGYGGVVFYYPGGFTEEGREEILRRVPKEQLIPIERDEALCFACNMVIIGETAIFPASPTSFTHKVQEAGLNPVSVDLSEFMKAGGAAKCLSLWLSRSEIHPALKTRA